MEYIVIDKDGNDITSQVRVMRKDSNDWKYCRIKADEMLKMADEFFEKEIMSRYELISNTKMEDFGTEFDPDRGTLWSKRIDEIREELIFKNAEHDEMMRIAGDWEDKEYAARLSPIIEFLSVRSKNPLITKHNLKENFKAYVEHMGMPSMATYI
jgi:hypothetical protein